MIEVIEGICAGRRGEVVRQLGDTVTVRLAGDPAGMLRVYAAKNVREVEEVEARHA